MQGAAKRKAVGSWRKSEKHPHNGSKASMGERQKTIKDRSEESLSGRQERLLSKLHDGECGLVERLLAERLVSRLAAARRFMARLDEARRVMVERADGAAQVDLWSKISMRIDQEQRAEVFLGRRRETLVERVVGFVREHRHIAWGVPSGVALAGLILLFVAPSPAPNGGEPLGIAREGASYTAAPTVNLASAGSSRSYRAPVEVDWVRGSGRVRVMQDPQRSSAIIWVRRPQGPRFLPGERFVAPTPLGGAPLGGAPLQPPAGGYPR